MTEKYSQLTGTVLTGSRNIFTVRPGELYGPAEMDLECRIKGKILKESEGFYNPLAPGDRVIMEPDPGRPGTAMITALEKRRNLFSRMNQKAGCTQLLAANVDLVLCLTSGANPPFRPRFLDRVLLQADSAGIPPLIIVNKIDIDYDDIDVDERLEDFRRIGYEVIFVSAKTGEGIDELRLSIAGKRSVLVGQSGVGKSSLINALLTEQRFKTGIINEKYDRGNHTTTLASMVRIGTENNSPAENGGTWIIDTPGIRRFVPDGIGPGDLVLAMREFAPLAGKCTYGLSCSHRVEPGCKIMEAVHAGVIHEDRYTSFLRIHDELSGKNNGD